MKRILFLTVCLFIVNFCAWGETLPKAYRSHNGQLTQYLWNEWQEAITEAEAGDTIFLTEGSFSNDITIDKPLTIIGTGVAGDVGELNDYRVKNQGTYIKGHVTIDIPGSISLTSNSLENIRMHTLTVNSSVTNLRLRKCYINENFNYHEDNNYPIITNLLFINCYAKRFYCENLEHPVLQNSLIWSFQANGYPGNTFEIINCGFGSAGGQNTQEYTFYNCTFDQGSATNCHFVNCLFNNSNSGDGSNCFFQNCWRVNYYNPNNASVEELTENEWIGTDGTAVGCKGGMYPFTFVPTQPSVSESNVSLSDDKKTLNVTLKVTTGQ